HGTYPVKHGPDPDDADYPHDGRLTARRNDYTKLRSVPRNRAGGKHRAHRGRLDCRPFDQCCPRCALHPANWSRHWIGILQMSAAVSSGRPTGRVPAILMSFLVAVIVLGPVAWALATSFKTEVEAVAVPPT